MSYKNIIQAALLFVMGGMLSCSSEDWGDGNGPEVEEGRMVSVRLDLGTPVLTVQPTKAGADDPVPVVNDLAVVAYNPPGNGAKLVGYWDDYTVGEPVEFEMKSGKHKVYVLANAGSREAVEEMLKGKEQKTLLEQVFDAESTEPTGQERMLGFVTKAGEKVVTEDRLYEGIEISDGDNLSATLVPPFAKVSFTVNRNLPEGVTVEIREVNVRNLPVKYALQPAQSVWKMGDGVNDGVADNARTLYNNAESGTALGEDALAFYLYENLQGVHGEGNTDPKMKTPKGLNLPAEGEGTIGYEEWQAKWATVPCTYIEVKGVYTSAEKAGPINYRFFLGENDTDNFDICRNKHYQVSLDLSGGAGTGELAYEWRVQADLEEVTAPDVPGVEEPGTEEPGVEEPEEGTPGEDSGEGSDAGPDEVNEPNNEEEGV